jgi:hypothetical protein
MMRKALPILLMLVLGGCTLPFGKAKYESYHPIIKDMASYPGGVGRQEFWAERERWLDVLTTGEMTAKEREILKQLFDGDTVLEAREAQIASYNKWAEEQNRKNGYTNF